MTFRIIYDLVKRIPVGKVTTYKQIALKLRLKDIRIIGYALHKNPDPKTIPCHRVILSDGSLASGYAFGGASMQKELLLKEGVQFKKGKVDLELYLWPKQN